MLARIAEIVISRPPLRLISSLRARRLGRVTVKIGLSFDRRIRRLSTSVSESGGVGGVGKDPGRVKDGVGFLIWCCWRCALAWRILFPCPPGGKRASTQGTPRIVEK